MAATSYRGADGYAYVIPMSRSAYRSLAWIADRYSSAELLYGGARWVRDVLVVPEHVAHGYLLELEEEEDGSPMVPPCAGGPLADALLALAEAVV